MELPVSTGQDAKRRAFVSAVRAGHRIARRLFVRDEDLETVVSHSRLAAIAIKNLEGELFAGILHQQRPAPMQRPILAIVRQEPLHERDRRAVQVERTSVDPELVPVVDPLERALDRAVAVLVETAGDDVRAERLIHMARRRVLLRLYGRKIDPAAPGPFWR